MVNKAVKIGGVAFLILFLSFGTLALISPGYITAGLPFLFAAPQSCDIAPFDTECYCVEGEERFEIDLPGQNRFFCEKEDKFIDPDVVGWETTGIQEAETILAEQFATCDMNTCGDELADWQIGVGIMNNERRTVHVECMDSLESLRFAHATYTVEDGAILGASCGNFDEVVDPTTSEEPAQIEIGRSFDRFVPQGRYDATLSVSSKCGDDDNGKAITTINSPRGHIARWQLESCPLGASSPNAPVDGRTDLVFPTTGFCANDWMTVIEETPEYVTFEVDTQCPHGDFGGFSLAAIGYYEDQYYNDKVDSLVCYDGERVIANGDDFCTTTSHKAVTQERDENGVLLSSEVITVTFTNAWNCENGVRKHIAQVDNSCDDSVQPIVFS